VNDFWLPAHNQSVSAIRVGGRAELTIDYRNYEITRASQVGSLRMLQAMPYSEIARANRDNTVSHEGRR
jgi:hypothetical protein